MLEAVNDFLLKYLPGITQDMLYRGWQNRMALPANQTYVIYALDSTQRHGTNVRTYEKTGPDIMVQKVLREYIFVVDLFSNDNEKIFRWANNIEILMNCYKGVDFFKQYSCNGCYADEVQYLPYTDLTNQYVERYRVMIHLTKWETLDTVQDFANEVVLLLRNVDERRDNE